MVMKPLNPLFQLEKLRWFLLWEDDSADLEEDSDDIDDMLENDFDDDYPEKDRVKKIDSSLRIEDDD